MKGKVKWFDTKKGIGFITTEQGNDLFVHHTGLAKDYRGLQEGQEVEFDIMEGKRGPQATNVSVLA